jgi:hypothetical protein
MPAEQDPAVPPDGTAIGDLVWQPWHPVQVARLLQDVTAPWCVAAGWALDLCRGEQTREHEDLEIAIPNTPEAFGQVRAALSDYAFEVPVGPEPGTLWPLDSPAFDQVHQTWVSEPEQGGPDGEPTSVYRLDIFREPQRDGRWVCRRDQSITMSYEEIIRRDPAGIPYLVPQIVLLFKAKLNRAKDNADLAAVLPLMAPADRAWLGDMLQRVHPGHEWLAQL